MDNSDLVSIIVPVYGVEAYLSMCVDSLLAQIYENIEIILVDDESPDHCPKICDAYSEKDSRVRVFHKKNGGAASARNVGLDNASGKYICFVDSDDIACKTYISSLIERLKTAEADLAVCGYYCLFQSKKERIECFRSNQVVSQKEYLLQFLEDWTCGLIWNKIFIREKIGTVRFPEGHKIDDEFFTYQVVMNSSKVVLFDEPLYEYRMRTSSVMGASKKYNGKLISDKLEYIVERYEKVTAGFPELSDAYLHNLMDNLIILLRKSRFCEELNLRVQEQIRKFKRPFLMSSASVKEKVGFLRAIYQSVEDSTETVSIDRDIEDYFV